MTHIKQKINKQKGHAQTLPAHTVGMFWTIGTQPEMCTKESKQSIILTVHNFWPRCSSTH